LLDHAEGLRGSRKRVPFRACPDERIDRCKPRLWR
jgi:hypothetical protein